jgi:hypothetical protein
MIEENSSKNFSVQGGVEVSVKHKIKRYKERNRDGLIEGGDTDVICLAHDMSFDALLFWIGLGILLGHGCTLKATHDKLTAWLPAEPLPFWKRMILRRTGKWDRDEDFPEEAWTSHWVNG